MQKKEIRFTQSEIRLLMIWGNNTIHGGHYGDGDIVLPDESILLRKLQDNNDGNVLVNQRDLEVLLVWASNTIGGALRGITPEEISVLEKIKQTQHEWQDK